jgi:hypothetical protein
VSRLVFLFWELLFGKILFGEVTEWSVGVFRGIIILPRFIVLVV